MLWYDRKVSALVELFPRTFEGFNLDDFAGKYSPVLTHIENVLDGLDTDLRDYGFISINDHSLIEIIVWIEDFLAGGLL